MVDVFVEEVMTGVKTIFIGNEFSVSAKLSWSPGKESTGDYLYWMAEVGSEITRYGRILVNESQILPSSIDCGLFVVNESEMYDISVSVSLDAEKGYVVHSGSTSLFAIASGVSLIPLMVVVLVALVTRKVELSLGMGVFVGAFIINGCSIIQGFERSLDQYLLGAVADEDHQYVILFTLFLGGLVGMMEKSGGVFGLTSSLVKYAKTPRLAQLIALSSGYLLFFDDYANCLVVGSSMRPILDLLSVSREKLAFIVDATAAPVASLIPVSSWVGFEVNQIQTQLDIIIERNGGVVPDGLSDNGFAIYLQSIPYRFYPIFMLFFQVMIILSKREFGPMLVAERKTQVYRRKDGGDGAFKGSKGLDQVNQAEKDTPPKAWNMLVPIALLVFFILWVLIQTGKAALGDDVKSKSFVDIIQHADSYSALLFGTMGASICTLIFYLVQFKLDGKVYSIVHRFTSRKSATWLAGGPSVLVDSFLHGLSVLFPAIVVLCLAWAIGEVMTDINVPQLFSNAIMEGGLAPQALPAMSFVLSLFCAATLGSSWSTMAIMFPLITVPTWESTQDIDLFLVVIGSVLSGAVCGDHLSPISDTSVLSAVASQCELTAHVWTQLPYALLVAFWSVTIGYLPCGYGTFSAGVSITVGFALLACSVFLLGVPVISMSGRFDPVMELYMKCNKKTKLHGLKADTRKVASMLLPSKEEEEMEKEKTTSSSRVFNRVDPQDTQQTMVNP